MLHSTFDGYQAESSTTNQGAPRQMPPLVYFALAVNEEAGELAGKVKKVYRDDDGILTAEARDGIIDEGGDTLWYLTRLCEVLGITLAEMAHRNTVKLQGRRERGTLKGSGDKR